MSEFNKRSYKHDDYPNKVLVIYNGDEKVVNKNYSHGNSTHKEKKLTSRIFGRHHLC
jgi:hypothetical protein